MLRTLLVCSLASVALAATWTKVSDGPWTENGSATAAMAWNSGVLVLGNDQASSHVWSFNGTWELLATPPWQRRTGFPTVKHGRYFVLGGCNGPHVRFNDVWTSDDGRVWERATAAAPWTSRCCSAAASLGGRIFLFGGHDQITYRNDVWASTDGVAWVRLPDAPWLARDAHSSVVFNSEIYMLGGHRDGWTSEFWCSDVWATRDGSSWREVTGEAAFGRRSGATLVVFGGKMILAGGEVANAQGQQVAFNDVWTSTDGATWIQVESVAPWSKRAFHAAVVSSGRLLVMSGYDPMSYHLFSDVWESNMTTTVQNSIASFVSNNQLKCVEGVPEDVEGALAMAKSSPTGLLYNESWGRAGVNCASLGFSGSSADMCYPGVTAYFRNGRIDEFRNAEHQALRAFQETYHIEAEQAELLAACSCHPKSTGWRSKCDDVTTVGSWIHTNRDVNPPKEYLCNEGPWAFNLRILATQKSSPLLQLHLGDQLAPLRCHERGFPTSLGVADHCFGNKLHLWWKGPARNYTDLYACEAYESNITAEFHNYVLQHRLETVLEDDARCNCLDGSSLRSSLPASECTSRSSLSPIRQWWNDPAFSPNEAPIVV